MLTLNYTYTDNTGAARMGSINIPYSTTSSNTVGATASPAGQITAAIKGGSQAVAIDVHHRRRQDRVESLRHDETRRAPGGLEAAARAASNAASVSTGNGCQLMLSYAPAVLGNGTLALNYAYDDDAGVAQTGTLNLPYEATTNDNVTATPSPSGQINAVVGMGTQNVAVVFTTDDGRLATDLQVTSSSPPCRRAGAAPRAPCPARR